MIEVYRHRKNPRVRLYKEANAPLPKQAHKDAWELLRTEQSVDSDAAQQMEKRGFALARVNLRFDELFAPAKGPATGNAGAPQGKPAGQAGAGARPGQAAAGGARPGKPAPQAKGRR